MAGPRSSRRGARAAAHGLIVSGCMVSCLASGCATAVSGGVQGQPTGSDELWYAKTRYFMGFKTGMDIYYCPPGQGPAQKACKKAVLHDE